jgi:hypothetical protein
MGGHPNGFGFDCRRRRAYHQSMSSPGTPRAAQLTSLPGGRRVRALVNGIEIVVAREDDAPFTVDAVVVEDDTWRALGAPADVLVSPGHPVRVMTGVWQARPEAPGAVVVQRGTPLRLLAVVHDLDAEPSWKEAWIEAALDAVLVHAEELGLPALRVPLLGCQHGGLDPFGFARLLGQALQRRADGATAPRRIWLVRGRQSGAELLRAIRES